MTRVPKTRSRMKRRKPSEAVFQAATGSRLLAGGLAAVIALLLLVHQTQIEGLAVLLRLAVLAASVFFAALAWYFIRRGLRRGPVLRVAPEGFGIALGFAGWHEVPWEAVTAFRYWEPTGLALLIKRRQARWVGVLLKDPAVLGPLSWDERFEIWLNTFHTRPELTVLHPFVRAPILDVLQAFKDFAPKELDDFGWMTR